MVGKGVVDAAGPDDVGNGVDVCSFSAGVGVVVLSPDGGTNVGGDSWINWQAVSERVSPIKSRERQILIIVIGIEK
jgi:hypothetical protein